MLAKILTGPWGTQPHTSASMVYLLQDFAALPAAQSMLCPSLKQGCQSPSFWTCHPNPLQAVTQSVFDLHKGMQPRIWLELVKKLTPLSGSLNMKLPVWSGSPRYPHSQSSEAIHYTPPDSGLTLTFTGWGTGDQDRKAQKPSHLSK